MHIYVIFEKEIVCGALIIAALIDGMKIVQIDIDQTCIRVVQLLGTNGISVITYSRLLS